MRRYLVLARFPDRVREAVATGVVGRGISEGYLAIEGRCLTDFGLGKHRKIDDKPFGGGAGLSGATGGIWQLQLYPGAKGADSPSGKDGRCLVQRLRK